MTTYYMTPRELKTMNVTKFQNITKHYNKIYLTKPYTNLSLYFIQQRKTISCFHEKLDILIDYFVEKEEWDLSYVLEYFLDKACFALALDTVKTLIQKGCKLNKESYDFESDAPLFRTFLYNQYILQEKRMNTLRKRNLEELGKLLIQHGALFEINVKEYRYIRKITIIQQAKTENVEHVLSYIEGYQSLFNPEQQKQWKKLRFTSLFN